MKPDVTQPKRDKIVDYLARSFPKHVNVNSAASKDLEAALELSTKEADAIVSFRQAPGAFRTLDDLNKVPGVDAAKVESVKNRVDL